MGCRNALYYHIWAWLVNLFGHCWHYGAVYEYLCWAVYVGCVVPCLGMLEFRIWGCFQVDICTDKMDGLASLELRM